MLYDFKCKKCGKELELMCSFKVFDELYHFDCGGKLERLYTSFPEFCKGVGSDTRLSDIAPNENASDEVKTKFKKMLRTRPINPLKIKTKG